MTTYPLERESTHLYVLQSHPPYWFHVGVSRKNQAIMGLLGSMFCVLLFDSEGCLCNVEEHELPELQKSSDYADELAAIFETVACKVSQIRKERDLRDESISIKRFWLPKPRAGIQDLPEELREYLGKAKLGSPVEVDLEEAVEGWFEESLYVFWWGQSFTVNDEGIVSSS